MILKEGDDALSQVISDYLSNQLFSELFTLLKLPREVYYELNFVAGCFQKKLVFFVQ
jgi:hypothetical protein